MKKIKLLLLLALCSPAVFCQIQQLKIVNFTVKNQLPPKIEQWATIDGAIALTAIKQTQSKLEEVKLVVQIKSNNMIVCGNNPKSAPLTKFSGTKTYHTTDIAALINGVESLKKGSYLISTRFYNVDNVAISEEQTKSFVIADDNAVKEPETPQLIETVTLSETTIDKPGGGLLPLSAAALALPGVDKNCEACNTVNINIPPSTTMNFYSNNTVTLAQSIIITAVPLKLIKSIKTELTYFEFTPDSDECVACNKNTALWGNFNTGTIAGVTGVGGVSRSLTFNYLPSKIPGSFPASLNMTLPPLFNCCAGLLRYCIRYVVAFDDCTVCSQTVCYEKKQTGTPVISENPIPVNNQN